MLETLKKFKSWIIAAGGVLFCAGLVYAGYSLAQPTIEDLAERNRTLAEQDSLRRIAMEDMRVAYQRAVFDFTSSEQVREALENENENLKDRVSYLEDELETAVVANANLRDSLETVVDNIAVTDTSVSADIRARNDYEDGFIAADGRVDINTADRTGSADLDFEVGMSPVLTVERDEEGLAQCTLSFGDMPIVVGDLKCFNNIDPDLPVRQSFWEFAPKFTVGSMVIVGSVLAVIVAF